MSSEELAVSGAGKLGSAVRVDDEILRVATSV